MYNMVPEMLVYDPRTLLLTAKSVEKLKQYISWEKYSLTDGTQLLECVLDVPGVSLSDIDVELDRVTRRVTVKTKRVTKTQGEVARTYVLQPPKAEWDIDSLQATLKDGSLTFTVKQKETLQPVKVQVNVA